VSIITNTNWQSYGGESPLSKFRQMGAITFKMFTSAATGFVVVAWSRAFTVQNGGPDLGNFYRDPIRFVTPVLMPVCFGIALTLLCLPAFRDACLAPSGSGSFALVTGSTCRAVRLPSSL
jgi:K+-transporting ATPase ATPase A chain